MRGKSTLDKSCCFKLSYMHVSERLSSGQWVSAMLLVSHHGSHNCEYLTQAFSIMTDDLWKLKCCGSTGTEFSKSSLVQNGISGQIWKTGRDCEAVYASSPVKSCTRSYVVLVAILSILSIKLLVLLNTSALLKLVRLVQKAGLLVCWVQKRDCHGLKPAGN